MQTEGGRGRKGGVGRGGGRVGEVGGGHKIGRESVCVSKCVRVCVCVGGRGRRGSDGHELETEKRASSCIPGSVAQSILWGAVCGCARTYVHARLEVGPCCP